MSEGPGQREASKVFPRDGVHRGVRQWRVLKTEDGEVRR